MYIGYDIKNGKKYAKICKSERINGKVKTTQIPLGRVINEEAGIYRNRKLGIFTYDLNTNTYGKPSASVIIPPDFRANAREKLILDFGDVFFLDEYISKLGLYPAIDALRYGNHDSVRCLLMFYVLCNMANYNAIDWLMASYARILYPNANLESQRISDLLEAVGDEGSIRAFFNEYKKLLIKNNESQDILIDSTGLPNNIHMPITAVSNHNGNISNEVRLIYVVQQGSNMPLYFRCVPGNNVDVTTLKKTILEMKGLNIKTQFAIMDAGYLSESNIKSLYDAKISFITRLPENRTLYKQIVADHLSTLKLNDENLTLYNSRFIHVKRIDCELLKGHNGYAYLALDEDGEHTKSSRLACKGSKDKIPLGKLKELRRTNGVFILVSSRPIVREKIVEIYYTRQQIEQIFDLCKNDTNLLPLRVHSEDTLRGHLVLTFIAAVIVCKLQLALKDTDFTPDNALYCLGKHRCKVYDDFILPSEPSPKQRKLYELFGMEPQETYPA